MRGDIAEQQDGSDREWGGEAVPLPGPAPRGLRAVAAWLALVGTVGLAFFFYRYLAELAAHQRGEALPRFIDESTGAFVAGLLLFPMRWLVRRLPLVPGRRARRLPVYAVAMLAGGAAATTAMWGLRSLLYPLAGLGAFDYGVMPLRYFMELPLQLLVLTCMAAALHAFAALDRARARELRAARIEGSLARAQLQNLRLQLQPHFLFNALHTISATMYDDPAAADEMLAQLAELLRLSLSTARTDEVPLAEELALLGRYVAIQRARFGDRLQFVLQVDPSAEPLLVPSLLLQPLVENAIRHGNAERLGRGRIVVRARRERDRLVLEVEDDGPGAPPLAASGLGLSATAERLQLLYGDDHNWSAGNAAAGGFLVRAAVPARLPPTAEHLAATGIAAESRPA
jgi:two-component system LytT family sensor kinase